jgi:hypothetical protein
MNNYTPPHNGVGYTEVRYNARPRQEGDFRKSWPGYFNGDGFTDMVLIEDRQLALYLAADRDLGPDDPRESRAGFWSLRGTSPISCATMRKRDPGNSAVPTFCCPVTLAGTGPTVCPSISGVCDVRIGCTSRPSTRMAGMISRPLTAGPGINPTWGRWIKIPCRRFPGRQGMGGSLHLQQELVRTFAELSQAVRHRNDLPEEDPRLSG